MAINWGEVLKYLWPGVSSAGATIGTAIGEAPELKRKKAMDDITIQNALSEQKQNEETQTRRGEVLPKLEELSKFQGTSRTSDVNMYPTGKESLGMAQRLGLPAYSKTIPEVGSALSGIESQAQTETEAANRAQDVGFKERELGLKQEEMDIRKAESIVKKASLTKELETINKKNLDDEVKRKYEAAKTIKDDMRQDKTIQNFNQMDRYNDTIKKLWTPGQKVESESLGPTDNALIKLYTLMLEPGLAVREDDVKLAVGGQAKYDEIVGKLEKWESGGSGFRNSYRDELVNAAGKIFSVAKEGYKDQLKTHYDFAVKYGDPEDIFSKKQLDFLTGNTDVTPTGNNVTKSGNKFSVVE